MGKKRQRRLNNFFTHIRWLYHGVKVYALIGKSGTGKSFRARLVAEKYGIGYFIDDGLLIFDSRIIAGRSAKKESHYIGAIKTALFDDPDHRYEVIQCLKKENIKKILLLGTSKKMVEKVAYRLNLPTISKIINIEDISTEEEIAHAVESRKKHGMHVIPVPTIEVKRDYSQILRDSINIFFKKRFGIGGKEQRVFEKSIVRPHFHDNKKGSIVISESALSQMIMHCFDEFDCEMIVNKIKIRNHTGQYFITVSISAPYGKQLGGKLHELQNYTIDHIQRFAGVMIEELSISIDKISMD